MYPRAVGRSDAGQGQVRVRDAAVRSGPRSQTPSTSAGGRYSGTSSYVRAATATGIL